LDAALVSLTVKDAQTQEEGVKARMRVCINCSTKNPDDAVLCCECGMSLTGARPQRLRSMVSVWVRAVTRPVPATYEELLQEKPNPTLSTAAGWIAIAGLIAAALTALRVHFLGMPQGMPAETSVWVWLVVLVATPVAGIISLVVLSAILLAIARAFRGEGNLASQSYLLAAPQVPLSIIAGSLVWIPYVWDVIKYPLMMYGIYLAVLALRAAHRFGWGRAVVTLLIPGLVLAAVYCACLFSLLVASFGAEV
jgi:hypothetical protein